MTQATFRLLASTTHLGSIKSQDTCHIPNFQGTPAGLQRPPVSKQCVHYPRGAGGASRDRTGDPLLAKQVLSQLSYSPV